MSYEELLALENIKQSQVSPSIVMDKEIVVRVLFSPKHYLDGEILPVAFEQIFSSNGMSILRVSHCFSLSLTKTITQLEQDGVKYIGYTSAKVQDIRDIKLNEYRVFYILDTATKDKIGHADIFAIRLSIDKCGLPKKAFKNYIRQQISKVFNTLLIIQ